MTLFYLVRHGETDWNREEVFRGRFDVPLNDRGRQEAQAAAQRLAAAGLAAVYTSPLARARETAEIVARAASVEAYVEEAFVDMDFGDWQGLPLTEVEKRYPELYETWRATPAEARIPGAESLTAVGKRAVAAVTVLAGRFPEEVLCIVTHRVVSKLVMAWALGLDEGAFWRIRQDTACVNAFAYDGREGAQPLTACCRLVARAPGSLLGSPLPTARTASPSYGALVEPRSAGPVVHLLNDTCHLRAVSERGAQRDF